jgi:ABC-type multidrug transport system ATPase subunit
VEKASFTVSLGECFALLGVNGAGKTTTFRALTRVDKIGISGEVLIGGKLINENFG